MMLDVSTKNTTLREATARAILTVQPATCQLVRDGKAPKGDPLAVARVAAIQAAKNTSQLIPYCHPLPIEFVGVDFDLQESAIAVNVQVRAIARTGVEMEALTAAGTAALTLYDMLKIVDSTMRIAGIELLSKRGGKSSFGGEPTEQLRAAVLVLSDTAAAGSRQDESGQLIRQRLAEQGLEVADYTVISDDTDRIAAELIRYADELKLDLVITTGGTGLGPRDNTPEALARIVERDVPGISEAARAYGQQRTPYAMLSRGSSGIRGRTLIVCLPGSPGAVAESLEALLPGLLHAFGMIRGEGHDPAGKGAST